MKCSREAAKSNHCYHGRCIRQRWSFFYFIKEYTFIDTHLFFKRKVYQINDARQRTVFVHNSASLSYFKIRVSVYGLSLSSRLLNYIDLPQVVFMISIRLKITRKVKLYFQPRNSNQNHEKLLYQYRFFKITIGTENWRCYENRIYGLKKIKK